jgi:hypothetical protein
MPRKKVVNDTIVKKPNKKNIIDSMIKENETKEGDDIILQIPIPQSKINYIINNERNNNKIVEPIPYEILVISQMMP